MLMKKLLVALLLLGIAGSGYYYYQNNKTEINGNIPEWELKDTPSAAGAVQGGSKAVEQTQKYDDKVKAAGQDQFNQ
jgi:hypothetical protein